MFRVTRTHAARPRYSQSRTVANSRGDKAFLWSIGSTPLISGMSLPLAKSSGPSNVRTGRSLGSVSERFTSPVIRSPHLPPGGRCHPVFEEPRPGASAAVGATLPISAPRPSPNVQTPMASVGPKHPSDCSLPTPSRAQRSGAASGIRTQQPAKKAPAPHHQERSIPTVNLCSDDDPGHVVPDHVGVKRERWRPRSIRGPDSMFGQAHAIVRAGNVTGHVGRSDRASHLESSSVCQATARAPPESVGDASAIATPVVGQPCKRSHNNQTTTNCDGNAGGIVKSEHVKSEHDGNAGAIVKSDCDGSAGPIVKRECDAEDDADIRRKRTRQTYGTYHLKLSSSDRAKLEVQDVDLLLDKCSVKACTNLRVQGSLETCRICNHCFCDEHAILHYGCLARASMLKTQRSSCSQQHASG